MIKVNAQAIAHWNTTTPKALGPPSSLLIEAIAATHGVYSSENIKRQAADKIESLLVISPPNNPSIVVTTDSLAIKPEIKAVTILQSPNPIGLMIGTRRLAISAMILSLESLTSSK